MSKADQPGAIRQPLRRISPQPNNEQFRRHIREAIEAGDLVTPDQDSWLDQFKNELITYPSTIVDTEES